MGTTQPTPWKMLRIFVRLGAVVMVIGLFYLVRGARAKQHLRPSASRDLSRMGALNPLTRVEASTSVAGLDTPPAGPNGKLAWFLRKYSERFAAAQHKMAIEQGADIDMLPKEWPQARYIADATAYPAVETYFLGYLHYLDAAKERYPVLMDSIARITVVESKMESADSADALKGIGGGFASRRDANLKMFDYGQAYGQAALRLHYYLASIGSRVSYNSATNTAKFEVDAERERVSTLLAEVQRNSALLAAASKR